MPDVHPMAVISAEARIDETASIGPYAVIDGPVVVGPRVRIHASALVMGATTLAEGVEVWPTAVIGGDPQHLGYSGEPTGLEIGVGTKIREGATIHRSVAPAPTRVGAGCLIMGRVHVGHDCQIGDRVVLSQGAGLAGHVEVGDGAVVGGMAGVHQLVRIGAYAMVGAMAKVSRDVLPYSMADGSPARHYRINTPGLRRAGIADDGHAAVRAALWAVRDGAPVGDGNRAVRAVAAFCRAPSRRGISHFAHPSNDGR